jgi:hypothetical protein
MDKRRKTGLIIMGACSLMLVVLLAVMGTGKEETQEQTEGNAPQEVAEGVTTPLNDSKSDAYMSGDSEGRTSNTQKHWDDCGEMLEQKEEERREGGDATTEDLFGPVPPASSGGGYAQARPYENPYRETPQEREERHRRRQEEAIEMAERMSGGQTEAEEEVPAPQEQAPEQKQEPVTEVRRTSVISSLDDEAGLIGSFGSDDTIFTDDGTRPFPCMFSKECRLRDGDRVSIILLEDIVVSGTLVPRNTHLMATASLSNRLELKIASLELNGRIIAFGYEAYDIDGSRGIYCPDVGNERVTVRSRGTGLISSTLNSRMGRVASDVVSTGVSLLQSRDGERTVSVPAGYTFFIMKKTEQ